MTVSIDPSAQEALAKYADNHDEAEDRGYEPFIQGLASVLASSASEDFLRDNPASIQIATCAIDIAEQMAELEKRAPTIAYDFRTFYSALVNPNIRSSTKVDIAGALYRVPGYDETKDVDEQSDDYHKAYERAAESAMHYKNRVERELRESRKD